MRANSKPNLADKKNSFFSLQAVEIPQNGQKNLWKIWIATGQDLERRKDM
jgi:hypothetical protein